VDAMILPGFLDGPKEAFEYHRRRVSESQYKADFLQGREHGVDEYKRIDYIFLYSSKEETIK